MRDLSLCFAATPDDAAQASLQAYVARIKPALVAAVGADAAATILEAFASAVMTEKRRIEAGGASRA